MKLSYSKIYISLLLISIFFFFEVPEVGNPALGDLGRNPKSVPSEEGSMVPSNFSVDLAIPLTAFCPEVFAKSRLLTKPCLILGIESCFCMFCSCSDFFWFPRLWQCKL